MLHIYKSTHNVAHVYPRLAAASVIRDSGRSNKTRQYTYKRNTEARSRNHSCRGRAICIAYSDCVSVALVIQRAMRMRCVSVRCGLSGSTIFSHVIS